MSTPIFSILLINWNTAELTLQAIQSALDDSASNEIPVEIIVVDNGSSDDSLQRIRESQPGVVIIENGSNLGFARAVNKGLAVRTGQHVILLNTDATFCPGTLKTIQRAFEDNPQVGIVGANLLNEDGSPQNSIAPFPTLLTEVVNKALLQFLSPARHERKVRITSPELLDVDSVIGACLAIRREALAAIGPLDERFFFFFEETDWCFQADRLGWRVVVAPEARVVHGQGKSSETVLVDVRIEYYRSRYRYFLKNHGKWRTILLFEFMLLKLTVETVSALVTLGLSMGSSLRARRRLSVVSRLLVWHIRGCPGSWGLEGKNKRLR
jgi:GT2 family glycosyltransferase